MANNNQPLESLYAMLERLRKTIDLFKPVPPSKPVPTPAMNMSALAASSFTPPTGSAPTKPPAATPNQGAAPASSSTPAKPKRDWGKISEGLAKEFFPAQYATLQRAERVIDLFKPTPPPKPAPAPAMNMSALAASVPPAMNMSALGASIVPPTMNMQALAASSISQPATPAPFPVAPSTLPLPPNGAGVPAGKTGAVWPMNMQALAASISQPPAAAPSPAAPSVSLSPPSAGGVSPSKFAQPEVARVAPAVSGGLPEFLPSQGGAGSGISSLIIEFRDSLRELKDVIKEWRGAIEEQKGTLTPHSHAGAEPTGRSHGGGSGLPAARGSHGNSLAAAMLPKLAESLVPKLAAAIL